MGKKIWNATKGAERQVEYTTDLTPSTYEWVESTDPLVTPIVDSLTGQAFVDAYGSHDDAVTAIDSVTRIPPAIFRAPSTIATGSSTGSTKTRRRDQPVYAT